MRRLCVDLPFRKHLYHRDPRFAVWRARTGPPEEPYVVGESREFQRRAQPAMRGQGVRFLASRVRPWVWALVLYLGCEVLLFGPGMFAHLQTGAVGSSPTSDYQVMTWSLEWWPWAVLHGHDPLRPLHLGQVVQQRLASVNRFRISMGRTLACC